MGKYNIALDASVGYVMIEQMCEGAVEDLTVSETWSCVGATHAITMVRVLPPRES